MEVFLARHHGIGIAELQVVFRHGVIHGEIQGVGEKLVGAALLAQHLVIHTAVTKERGLAAGRGIVFVVEVLDGADGDGGFAVAYQGATQPEVVEVFFQAFDFVGGLDTRHGDEHLLEGLVVAERQHGHLAQRDNLRIETDDDCVGAGECGIDGDEAARIADATHPKRVGLPGLDMEPALSVGDGAAVCHLADDMGVTDRAQAVGRDHIAVEIHALGFVVVLRDSGEAAQGQE